MNSKKRTLIIVLTLIVSITSVGLAAAMIIPSADELLTQSLETLETVSNGHAMVEANADLPGQTFSGTVEIWGEIGDNSETPPSWRMEVLSASKDELVGLTVVTNGEQFWLYSPVRNSVVVGQASELKPLLAEKMAEHNYSFDHERNFDPETAEIPQTPAEFVAKFLEYFSAERNGQEELEAGQAYLLRLIPIAEKMPEEVRAVGGFINLWIREADKLPIAGEFAESAFGYGKFEATMAEINIELDEGLFNFNIPAGTEIIEATELLADMETQKQSDQPLDFEVLTASLFPEGAVAEESQQVGDTIVQRYNLPDDQSFVIAQGTNLPIERPAEATSSESVLVRGLEGILYTNDAATRTLLTWNEESLWILVGGDLSPAEALAIAESLQ